MNFLKGVIRADGTVTVGESQIAPAAALKSAFVAKTGQPILLGMRPENLALVPAQQTNTLRAHVLVVEPLGSHKLLTMQVGSEVAKVSVPPDRAVASGDDVWLHFEADKIRWMDAASGEAIR